MYILKKYFFLLILNMILKRIYYLELNKLNKNLKKLLIYLNLLYTIYTQLKLSKQILIIIMQQ